MTTISLVTWGGVKAAVVSRDAASMAEFKARVERVHPLVVEMTRPLSDYKDNPCYEGWMNVARLGTVWAIGLAALIGQEGA